MFFGRLCGGVCCLARGAYTAGSAMEQAGSAAGFYAGSVAAVVWLWPAGAALLAGPWMTGLEPTNHVYAATVWILVIWTHVHVYVGLIMQLYCVARRMAGRMTARHDIDISNVALYWHFVAITVVITVAVIAGFPLVGMRIASDDRDFGKESEPMVADVFTHDLGSTFHVELHHRFDLVCKIGGPRQFPVAVRVAIMAYTVIALLGIGITGYIGYRRQNYGKGSEPYDADTPEDRHRFLGFSTLLLSGLSAVAVLYAWLVVIFFENCS